MFRGRPRAAPEPHLGLSHTGVGGPVTIGGMPAPLNTSITAGTTGHVSDSNTVHGVINQIYRTTVNVLGYGAVGNGTTDDTVAVQAALTAAGALTNGGAVVCAAGTYRVTAPLLVPSNVTVDGLGQAVILHDFIVGGGTSGFGTFSGSNHVTGGNTTIVNTNITIQNITVQTATDGNGKHGKHFEFSGVQGLKLINTRLRGVSGGWNSKFHNCIDVWIDRADWNSGRGIGNSGDGIHLYGGSGYLVSNCVVYSGDDALSLTTESANCWDLTDVVVTNCRLNSDYASCIKVSGSVPSTAATKRISFTNITGRQNAASGGVGISLNGSVVPTSSVSLTNVKIDCSIGTNFGVLADHITDLSLSNVDIIAPQSQGLKLDTVINGNINNVNVSAQRSTVSTNPDFRLDGCTNVRFTGGSSIGATWYGVLINTSTDVSFNGFLISGAAGTGIRVLTSDTVRVQSCRIKGCLAAFGDIGGGNTNLLVRSNDFRSNTGVSSLSAATTFGNNLGDGNASGTDYLFRGTGTPEAVVTAPVGSMFLRTDGGVSTTLYVKQTGTGNTGWAAK